MLSYVAICDLRLQHELVDWRLRYQCVGKITYSSASVRNPSWRLTKCNVEAFKSVASGYNGSRLGSYEQMWLL